MSNRITINNLDDDHALGPSGGVDRKAQIFVRGSKLFAQLQGSGAVELADLSTESTGSPTGTIATYATTTIPAGWLECNGQDVAKATYAELYALITTLYGTATNATDNFRLPDLRGRAVVGVGTGSGLTARALAAVGGAEDVTLSGSQIPNHTHTATVTDPSHDHSVYESAHGHSVNDSGHDHNTTGGNHTHAMNHGHSLSSTSHSHQLGLSVSTVYFNEGEGSSEQLVDDIDITSGYEDTGSTSLSVDTHSGDTASENADVDVSSATTGISVSNTTTGVAVQDASTGISVAIPSSGGGSTALGLMSPFLALTCIIKY